MIRGIQLHQGSRYSLTETHPKTVIFCVGSSSFVEEAPNGPFCLLGDTLPLPVTTLTFSQRWFFGSSAWVRVFVGRNSRSNFQYTYVRFVRSDSLFLHSDYGIETNGMVNRSIVYYRLECSH